jgi:hypothetical protein
MAANRVDIVDVVMNASLQFFLGGNGIRAAAVAEIEEDHGALVSKMLKAVEHMDRVGDDHGGAIPQLLKVQPNSVLRGHVVCDW